MTDQNPKSSAAKQKRYRDKKRDAIDKFMAEYSRLRLLIGQDVSMVNERWQSAFEIQQKKHEKYKQLLFNFIVRVFGEDNTIAAIRPVLAKYVYDIDGCDVRDLRDLRLYIEHSLGLVIDSLEDYGKQPIFNIRGKDINLLDESFYEEEAIRIHERNRAKFDE